MKIDIFFQKCGHESRLIFIKNGYKSIVILQFSDQKMCFWGKFKNQDARGILVNRFYFIDGRCGEVPPEILDADSFFGENYVDMTVLICFLHFFGKDDALMPMFWNWGSNKFQNL